MNQKCGALGPEMGMVDQSCVEWEPHGSYLAHAGSLEAITQRWKVLT